MTTFDDRPYKLIFFKKHECLPCAQALENLNSVLEVYPEYASYVTVMQKENHPALVAAYELELYPTVLILDQTNNEISRKVGVRFLTTNWWTAALAAIDNIRSRQPV